MIEIKNKTQCCGCAACANICPKECISMVADQEGFLYPSVNTVECINCDACVRVCPELNIISSIGEGLPSAYAAYALDESIRQESSSGGVFTVLADYVLKDGGVVFGAAFDDDFNVRHIFVDKKEDMYKLRGSKYLQSRTENCYILAKKFLNDGKKVLYSGTPCQIVGLHNYLGKDYKNLILVDIICHGVPSPLVWQKYLQSLPQASSGHKPRRISFRHKYYGWKRYSVSIKYDDTEYLCEFGKDKFMQAFLRDLCLRPSCYECPSKGEERVSDFTIADFWGIQDVMPEMDDDKGTSLVIIHTKKGKTIFNGVVVNIKYKVVDFYSAIKYNESMVKSVSMPMRRNSFMSEIIKDRNFDAIEKKYCQPNLFQKGRRFIVRIFNKIFKR